MTEITSNQCHLVQEWLTVHLQIVRFLLIVDECQGLQIAQWPICGLRSAAVRKFDFMLELLN